MEPYTSCLLEKRHVILTVTPNASIDKTYTVEDFGLDRINRASDCNTVPGGKGINVVRVLKVMGRAGLATGFVGGRSGEAILQGLTREGIQHDFVRVAGDSRFCIKIADPKNGTQTEINECGPTVSPDEIGLMMEKIRSLLPGKEFVVPCGSTPPATPASLYADIIRAAKEAGVRTVLDASGEQLAEGVKAAPFMVKPNVAELSELAGVDLYTLEEISRAAKSLKQYGVEITCVTMGRSGAIITDGVQVWKAVPPEISFASAVGSGDSFLAGFIDSYLNGDALEDALAWGTAAGAANATSYGAGFCSKESIMEIRQGVTLSKVC